MIILSIGGSWLVHETIQKDAFIEVVADKSRVCILPDSSTVWMRAGSSIRYAQHFEENRDVWLKGESLFEVRKQRGRKFRVHLDKAFIEVKGTSFLVKRNEVGGEVTLLTGLVDFHVQSTNQVLSMKPSQKITYTASSKQARLDDIDVIDWRNGRFNFSNIQLDKLIRTINELYSTNIKIGVGLTKEAAFTGSIRYNEPLNDVVNKICFALNFRQKEEQGTITIYN